MMYVYAIFNLQQVVVYRTEDVLSDPLLEFMCIQLIRVELGRSVLCSAGVKRSGNNL